MGQTVAGFDIGARGLYHAKPQIQQNPNSRPIVLRGNKTLVGRVHSFQTTIYKLAVYIQRST